MKYIRDLILYLFPQGTRGNAGMIDEPPVWPPDLFAVAAQVALISDCYTGLLNLDGPTSVGFKIHSAIKDIKDVANHLQYYTTKNAYPSDVEALLVAWWRDLINADVQVGWEASCLIINRGRPCVRGLRVCRDR